MFVVLHCFIYDNCHDVHMNSDNGEIHVCNICGSKTNTVTEIAYKSIVGMAEEYTMVVDYCSKCDLIFTANPFNNEKLANRYANFSKFEFDNDAYFLGED